jgi:uncharacterized protein (TIGR00251 family)
MADAFPFLKRTTSGVTVSLKVRPRAKRAALEVAADRIKVAINAPPVDGKANAAIIALLADTWRVPKSSFGIVNGRTSRTKTIAIAGDPAEIARRIADWAAANG